MRRTVKGTATIERTLFPYQVGMDPHDYRECPFKITADYTIIYGEPPTFTANHDSPSFSEPGSPDEIELDNITIHDVERNHTTTDVDMWDLCLEVILRLKQEAFYDAKG